LAASVAHDSSHEGRRAVLFATLDNLSVPQHLAGVISSVTQWTQERLVIVLASPLFDEPKPGHNSNPIPHSENWKEVQGLLTFVYVQATNVAQQQGKVLMEVDVLLKGVDEALPDDTANGFDTLYRLHCDRDCTLPHPLLSVKRTVWLLSGETLHPATNHPTPASPDANAPPLYPVVAVGGTFDHLHAGHKILLSMAAWIASEKVIVGVTDDALLTKKSNKEVLENLPTRIAKVTSFLALFRPGLTYDVVPINDVYGPTGWDPNIQALVVSKETLSGAASIASHRAEKSLPALRTFTIDVISHTSSNLEHEDMEMLKRTKMSSTFIREWIVNHPVPEVSGHQS